MENRSVIPARKKFFQYKSLDELRDDVQQLGLDITFEATLDAVWRSVRIGSRTAGNAFVIQPMEGCDGALDGTPGELTFRRWKRFGDGGAKLIWGEATAVVEDGRANPRQLFIHKKNVGEFARLVDETRRSHRNAWGNDGDLIVGVQLTHSGRWSHRQPVIAYHHPYIDKLTKIRGSVIPDDYPICTDDYLEKLEDAFVDASKLCVEAGFDFVDIKQCHSYLTHELLGARVREGKYGGDFENRTRLIRNILQSIQAEVGDRMILASRINAYDGIPFQRHQGNGIGAPAHVLLPYRYDFGVDENDPATPDLSETHRLFDLVEECGVKLVNVTLGIPYYNPHIGRPYEKPHDGGYLPPEHPLEGVARHFAITREMTREHSALVVVGTGYSWLQAFLINAAEANIRNGNATMAGVGRGALAYPDFVRDAREHGALSTKSVCKADSFCTTLMRSKSNALGQYPTGCVPRDKVYAQEYRKLRGSFDE